MSANVTHVRFHTKEAAEQIVSDALDIALHADVPNDVVGRVFEKAVDLLAAGVVLTPQAPMQLGEIDLSKLRG